LNIATAGKPCCSGAQKVGKKKHPLNRTIRLHEPATHLDPALARASLRAHGLVFPLPEVIRRLRGDRNGRAGEEEEGEGERQTHDNFLLAKRPMSESLQLSLLVRKFFGGDSSRFFRKRRSAVAAENSSCRQHRFAPVTTGKSALCIPPEKLVRLLL
jgi:hypothetical protein